ncbi:MAG: DUF4424 family protein [Elusimicrobiaceae bacterium]|nr:DUF4424 family protein [Elusimicrobiaceae bacterium]
MRKNFLYIFCALFMYAGFAVANDTSGQLLPTGEIRFEKQDGIVLKHEALLLSDTVTVDYLFENITDKPVETTVFFPIPTIGPINPYYMEYPHNFKFRVWINEKEIKPELSRKVTLDGTDVTKYFNLMGIDTYYKAITNDPGHNHEVFTNIAEPLRKLPIEEQKKLEKLGMLAKGCIEDEDGKCANNPDIYHLGPNPYYLAYKHYKQEVMYYWKQTFPPHKIIHVRHEYNPSVRTNSIGSPSSSVEKAKGISEYESYVGDFWTESSYIITTANNWKTPIEKFNLLVWGRLGAAVSTYDKDYKQTFVRVAPKNYLLETKQDFVPKSEISFELAYPNYDAFSKTKKSQQKLPQLYRVDGPANVRTKPNGKKIKTLENGYYIWAYPSYKKDWFTVLLDEETTGYTHKDNLIPFGKFDK